MLSEIPIFSQMRARRTSVSSGFPGGGFRTSRCAPERPIGCQAAFPPVLFASGRFRGSIPEGGRQVFAGKQGGVPGRAMGSLAAGDSGAGIDQKDEIAVQDSAKSAASTRSSRFTRMPLSVHSVRIHTGKSEKLIGAKTISSRRKMTSLTSNGSCCSECVVTFAPASTSSSLPTIRWKPALRRFPDVPVCARAAHRVSGGVSSRRREEGKQPDDSTWCFRTSTCPRWTASR